jgi:hypothetical protein
MSLFDTLLRRNGTAATAAEDITAPTAHLRGTTAGAINAEKVTMSRSYARSIAASEDVTMTLSGALRVDAGRDLVISGGGAPLIVTGGDLQLEGATAAMITAKEAHVESGFVGLLLSRKASLGDQTRILMQTREALIVALGIGVLWPIMRYLLNRFLPLPKPRETEADRKRPFYVRLGLRLLNLALRVGILVLTVWLVYRWARRRVIGLVPFAFRDQQ